MHTPSENQIRDFGIDIQRLYGPEYSPPQREMIRTWIMGHIQDRELQFVKAQLFESYKFRGSLPLISDISEALKDVRRAGFFSEAGRPNKLPQNTDKERQEVGKALEKMKGVFLGKNELPTLVPRELAGEISLEDYINYQIDFNEYLAHKRIEIFCGEKCKSSIPGWHRTWKSYMGNHYFGIQKCNAWKEEK